MEHQAGLWDGLKRLWRKWTGKAEYTGPTRTEDEVVDAFAEDFVENVMWPMTTEILRQIVIAADQAGLKREALPYLLFVWNRSEKEWPRMPVLQKVLIRWARNLVRSQGEMPNYQAEHYLPPPSDEAKIDQALLAFGFWLAGKGRAQLIRGYSKKLSKWAPAMLRSRPSLPANKASIYLQSLFQTYLKKDPRRFLDGDLLWQIVDLMFAG
ncbi:MAG: hypothetical protein ACYTFG_20100 [Planctomycetota bacterium]|jgi:hypothetical protein